MASSEAPQRIPAQHPPTGHRWGRGTKFRNKTGWVGGWGPRRGEPSRGVPSQATPSQAEPRRAEPIPIRARSGRAEPSRAEPGWTEPSRAEPILCAPVPMVYFKLSLIDPFVLAFQCEFTVNVSKIAMCEWCWSAVLSCLAKFLSQHGFGVVVVGARDIIFCD